MYWSGTFDYDQLWFSYVPLALAERILNFCVVAQLMISAISVNTPLIFFAYVWYGFWSIFWLPNWWTRLFLLRAKPGVRLMPHDHTGSEMTCVLSGGFSHDGNHYGPGDFDWGESGIGHEIAIGEEGECVCLIAMRGKLRLKGLLGRLIQPLIAI